MSTLTRVKAAIEVLATVGVLTASGVVIWSQFRAPAAAPMPGAPVEDVKDAQIERGKLTNVAGKARIAIVEFADFECPFCARHATETYPRIKAELVDKGVVEYAFVNFPLEGLHKNAFKAAEAAECAARQSRYWEMHEGLFSDRSALAVPALLKRADTLGLDRPRFEQCLNGEASAKVMADIAEGKRLGVESTPAIFLGTVDRNGAIRLVRRIKGAVPYELIKSEIEALQHG